MPEHTGRRWKSQAFVIVANGDKNRYYHTKAAVGDLRVSPRRRQGRCLTRHSIPPLNVFIARLRLYPEDDA